MICRLLKYTIATFLALMVSVGLTCCIDDDIVADCNDPETDDFAIVFDISLGTNPGGTTRANIHNYDQGDPIDSEVDIEGSNHDFRILFFDKDDKFLFEPTNLQYKIEAIDDYNYDGTTTKRWQARIASKVLEAGGALSSIKNENFKIAVLANWPKDNPIQFSSGDKVTKLSHYYPDATYTESYSYLTSSENANSWGAYTNWVKNNHSNAAGAESFIRNGNYPGAPFDYNKPGETADKVTQLGHCYKHIWRIWNFRGNSSDIDNKDNNGDYVYYNGAETSREKWKEINKEWCQLLAQKNNIATSRCRHGYQYSEDDKEEKYALDFKGDMEYTPTALKLKNIANDNNYKDIALYNSDKTAKEKVMHFQAFADGTLKIKAITGSSSTGKDIIVGVQIEASDKGSGIRGKDHRADNLLHLGNTSDNNIGLQTLTRDITVEHNPIDIYIYSINGNANIHEVEFIENTYLYDTDRRGRLPEESDEFKQLIPMYGIQTFTPIGNYLATGQTLNLSSNESGYSGKRVHLLRSLAKVELFLPENWNPTHIYMRSMNRTNRCEPLDVSTPTNELWQNVDDEITSIVSNGVFYDKDDNQEKGTNKMIWFYGRWSENGSKATSPGIYNSRIQRSDYVRLVKTELQPVSNFTRYILYMPEKNIDDPTKVGEWSSTPKVPHIELRFNGINEGENLEDNDCYRIYFAEQQQYKTVPDPRSDPSNYEKDLTGTGNYPNNRHYPIMRNHIYRFTVTGGDKFQENKEIEVILDVDPWDEMELNPSFGLDDKDGVTDNDPWDENEQNPNAGQDDKDGTVDNDPWDESDQNPSAGKDDKDGTVDNDPWDESDQNPSFGN